MRVFHDRLISKDDKDYYKKMCSEVGLCRLNQVDP
jgi:hypothetical protein